jgi:hypothetical protein
MLLMTVERYDDDRLHRAARIASAIKPGWSEPIDVTTGLPKVDVQQGVDAIGGWIRDMNESASFSLARMTEMAAMNAPDSSRLVTPRSLELPALADMQRAAEARDHADAEARRQEARRQEQMVETLADILKIAAEADERAATADRRAAAADVRADRAEKGRADAEKRHERREWLLVAIAVLSVVVAVLMRII